MKAAAVRSSRPTETRAAANYIFQKKNESKGTLGFADNRPGPAAGLIKSVPTKGTARSSKFKLLDTPIQRMLMYNKKGKKIEANTMTDAGALGDKDALFANRVGQSYAQYLQDSPFSISVINAQKTGLKELAKVIKAAGVDKDNLITDLANSVAGNYPPANWEDDWVEEVFKKFKTDDTSDSLPLYIDKKKDFDADININEEDSDNETGTKEMITEAVGSPSDYENEFDLVVEGTKEWLKTKITKNNVSGVLPELNAILDATVYDILGAALYEETGQDLDTSPGRLKAPPTPIWVQLLSTLNSGGVITRMAHNIHYDTTYGHGAEFVVDTPQEEKEKYQGKAVLHTHYDDSDDLVKAHTKPHARRFDRGYGKYDVSIGRLNLIADTNKDWAQIDAM